MTYLKTRLEMGEKYDPVRFEEDYLRLNGLNAVCVRQKELGRVMQDLCILHGAGRRRVRGQGPLYPERQARRERAAV